MATKHPPRTARPARRAQLNVRSDFASERARQISRDTGMTVTEVVEDALRRYVPPRETIPEGLMRVGGLLVFKPFGLNITAEEAQQSLEDSRERDIWGTDDDGAA